MSRRSSREARRGRAPAQRPILGAIALFAVFLAAALVVYRSALSGSFFSDDLHYLTENRYIQDLSWYNLVAILEPWGPTGRLTGNYAPVQFLVHALEWQLFGTRVQGYHVVNVVVHAIGSVLFVAVLRRSRVPLSAAAVGGAVFLLHPANVEAVAWICPGI